MLLALDGYSAMTAVNRPQSPTEMAIIGLIDELSLLAGCFVNWMFVQSDYF